MLYILPNIPANLLLGKTGDFHPVSSESFAAAFESATAVWVIPEALAEGLALYFDTEAPKTIRTGVTLCSGDSVICVSVKGPRADLNLLSPETLANRGFAFIGLQVA